MRLLCEGGFSWGFAQGASAFLGCLGWLFQACSGLPVPSLSFSVLLWLSTHSIQGGGWSLAQCWRAHRFCWHGVCMEPEKWRTGPC